MSTHPSQKIKEPGVEATARGLAYALMWLVGGHCALFGVQRKLNDLPLKNNFSMILRSEVMIIHRAMYILCGKP